MSLFYLFFLPFLLWYFQSLSIILRIKEVFIYWNIKWILLAWTIELLVDWFLFQFLAGLSSHHNIVNNHFSNIIHLILCLFDHLVLSGIDLSNINLFTSAPDCLSSTVCFVRSRNSSTESSQIQAIFYTRVTSAIHISFFIRLMYIDTEVWRCKKSKLCSFLMFDRLILLDLLQSWIRVSARKEKRRAEKRTTQSNK